MGRIFLGLFLLLFFLVPLPGLTFLNYKSFALDRSGQIKGKVVDAESKSPIGFAYVNLYMHKDTVPFQMTVTDIQGEFVFNNLPVGSYSVKVHLLGFKDFDSKVFVFNEKSALFRLDPIVLQIDNFAIGEVTVKANAGNPVSQPEKKTIYVENQLAGAGGSASDLLRQLPSVTQTSDGKIAIHGNSHLLVFIDGKPTALKGDELLLNTPAAEIRKIELITSPSAKYDASGSGGIINLITKKSTVDGVNGNLVMAVDHLGGYTSDFLLNYRYHRFNFFSGVDMNRRRNEASINYDNFYPATNEHFAKLGIQKAQRTNIGFRTGFDYLPTNADRISVSGNMGNFETTNNGAWHINQISAFANGSSQLTAADDNVRPGQYGGADMTYEHKFDTKKKSLSFSALWNTMNYDDRYLNLAGDFVGNEQMKQSTQLTKVFHNFQFNADFSAPAGKAGNFEMGYQLALNRENETYQSVRNLPLPFVVTDQENHFSGVIHAGYGTWQYKVKQLTLKAGLRAENLNRSLQTLDNQYSLSRFNLYPTFNSSYKIDSIQEILLNYSRRTDQLRTVQLDPLPRWYDFYNVTMGNPNLRNEVTDKIAIDYLLSVKNFNLSTELYFYNTSDKIEVIRTVYQDQIIRNRFENFGSERTIGLEFNTNWLVSNWFTLNEKLDLIGSSLDVTLEQIAQKRSYRQGYSVTTANLTLTPTTALELEFSYYGPALTAQSNIDQVILGGMTIRQQFINKKLTLTLTGRDFLGLYQKTEHVQGTAFDQSVYTKIRFPIRFSISYKFNHYKRDERRVAKSPAAE